MMSHYSTVNLHLIGLQMTKREKKKAKLKIQQIELNV